MGSGPRLTNRATEEAAARQRRLEQALRENLRKRKAQQRGRDALPADSAEDGGAQQGDRAEENGVETGEAPPSGRARS